MRPVAHSSAPKSATWTSVAAAALVSLGALGCRATDSGPPPADDVRAIRDTLETLYRSFSFDGGRQADWELMRSLFVDGAAFVAPIGAGETPRAVGADVFVNDFKRWIATSPEGGTGLHERITHARIDLFGNVAHAYVVFDGFLPDDGTVIKRGLDSIQLVRDRDVWRVASFTTHYASEDAPIPERFE